MQQFKLNPEYTEYTECLFKDTDNYDYFSLGKQLSRYCAVLTIQAWSERVDLIEISLTWASRPCFNWCNWQRNTRKFHGFSEMLQLRTWISKLELLCWDLDAIVLLGKAKPEVVKKIKNSTATMDEPWFHSMEDYVSIQFVTRCFEEGDRTHWQTTSSGTIQTI